MSYHCFAKLPSNTKRFWGQIVCKSRPGLQQVRPEQKTGDKKGAPAASTGDVVPHGDEDSQFFRLLITMCLDALFLDRPWRHDVTGLLKHPGRFVVGFVNTVLGPETQRTWDIKQTVVGKDSVQWRKMSFWSKRPASARTRTWASHRIQLARSGRTP